MGALRTILLGLGMLAAGCGHVRVDTRAVESLPLEVKLDLIEAENDLFIAVDAVDEAQTRALDAREDLRRARKRVDEAEEALKAAKRSKDPKLLEVAKLAVKEAEQREDFLDTWVDIQWDLLDVEQLELAAARARFERVKAQAVKKANVKGAEKIDLKDFDEEVARREKRAERAKGKVKKAIAKAEKEREAWNETRRLLAEKSGGGQGSPWVQ